MDESNLLTRNAAALYYVFGLEDAFMASGKFSHANEAGRNAAPFAEWFALHATRFNTWQVARAYHYYKKPVSLVKSPTNPSAL